MLFIRPRKMRQEDYPKTLVYTTIFGNRERDFLKSPFLIPKCDYVCFTDRNLSDKIWQIHKIHKEDGNPRRRSRIYKMLGHNIFP